jgi:hypothetical protein
MERTEVLFFTIVTFLVFLGLTYYGVGVTLWSSIAFAVFISFIILNIFYPPGKMASDNPDFTLGLYAFIEIVSVIIILIYVGQKSLKDFRYPDCPESCFKS